MEQITVLLVDDNLIVREGVRALLERDEAVKVVGVGADLDELIAGAVEHEPQVVVTDIRMPPGFTDEGIQGAKEVRKRFPGTGVVILSQFDEPEYAVSLLAEGAAGYAYLLKDRVADGGRLSMAIREVAQGGSMLDPEIVSALVAPARGTGALSQSEEELLRKVAEGRTAKAIAAGTQATPESVDAAIEDLFLHLARDASAGSDAALQRLKMLRSAIVQREETGQQLSRLLPGGLAEKLANDKGAIDRTESLEVTVLMSDVRGYSGIAEHTDPATLAAMLNGHRSAMNDVILAQEGTVMQYVGDAVMAVFGAPVPLADHAERAIRAATAMHSAQDALNSAWEAKGYPAFGLGIGLSTGTVAAAMLGSEERLEYTLVGDTVNMAQRLEGLARPAGTTVISSATAASCASDSWDFEQLPEQLVKGRSTPVQAFRLAGPRPAPVGVEA